MSEQQVELGIKEVKEVQAAVNKLVIKLAPLLIDGVSVSDLIEGLAVLNGDPEAKAAIEDALDGIGAVPSEIKDLSWSEGVELGLAQLKALPEILAAFKKKEV